MVLPSRQVRGPQRRSHMACPRGTLVSAAGEGQSAVCLLILSEEGEPATASG